MTLEFAECIEMRRQLEKCLPKESQLAIEICQKIKNYKKEV